MTVAFDGGGDHALLKIAAARVIACDKMPYLATALFAMVPVKVAGLGTLASDAKWRLYWDPEVVEKWPVEQLAGVLLHEVGHCIRGHADRFATLSEPMDRHLIFNVSGDSLINVDLRDERIPLPEGCVYVEQIEGATREMSAEQIYWLLIEQAEKNCTCNKDKGDESEKGEKGDKSDQGQSGKGEKSEEGDEQGEGSGDGDEGDEQGQSGEGQGEGSGDGEQEGQGGGGNGADPNCPVHGNHNGHGHGNPQPGSGGIPKGWDCGSASDGVKRDYEAEGDKVDKGVDDDRADLIKQQVAVEITNHVKNRGTVPAGLARWAKDILDPVVDWRRELASIVRRTFASVAGRRDYSYQRPSRRQSAMQGSGQHIILPAMRQPNPPTIAIVIDTSGSMSDDMLAWALSETQGVLRSLGSSDRAVRLYACDASVDSGQRIRNASQVKLTGGGGTDMRVGIKAAMEGHPKPDCVLLLTDGYTPYPDEPLKGATLIVGLTDEGASDAVPSWARKVIVTRETTKAGRR